jgi:hypothetical protein
MSSYFQTAMDDGSYIAELARRAIDGDIPDSLVVDRLTYVKCRNYPQPMVNLLTAHPEFRKQLATYLDFSPTEDLANPANLQELSFEAIASPTPEGLFLDQQTYDASKTGAAGFQGMIKLLVGHPEFEKQLALSLGYEPSSPDLKDDARREELAFKAATSPTPPELFSLDIQSYEAQKNTRLSDCGLMIRLLDSNPELQEQLAFCLDYVPSKWLLSRELEAVIDRRTLHNIAVPAYDPKDPYTWARKEKLQGICFSGGGIRSATFNLGVLQGLAKLDLLYKFDYLSSVSGGGYIHEWLVGWIKREEDKPPASNTPEPNEVGARRGLRHVQNGLDPLPANNGLKFAPEPIRWLRRYSNYLTPQVGIFTADTWVAISIWLRNTFLNQLILVSFLFLLVLVPDLFAPGLQAIPTPVSFSLAFVLFLVATLVMWGTLNREYNRVRYVDMHGKEPHEHIPRGLGGELAVQFLVVLPLLLGSLLLTSALVAGVDLRFLLTAIFLGIAILIAGLAFAGGTVRTYKINQGMITSPDKVSSDDDNLSPVPKIWGAVLDFVVGTAELLLSVGGDTSSCSEKASRALDHWRTFISGVLSAVFVNGMLAAAGSIGLVFLIGALLHLPNFPHPGLLDLHLPAWIHTTYECTAKWRVQLTFGPPLLLFVPFFGMMLASGLVGRNYPDWLREWLARVRAWSMLFGMAWLAYIGISLLGPSVSDLFHTYSNTWEKSIKWSALLTWGATTVGSVLAGNSAKASGTNEDRSRGLNVLADVGPYVFIVGLLVILSAVANSSFHDLYTAKPLSVIGLVAGTMAVFLLFGWRVDINEFSMNPFYRNRLTRCYLGATNADRDPNPLTGFDDRDTRGLQIAKLQPSEGYSGPLPIINTTINLSFGEDLAWQERKAASFFFGPLFSGYTVGWTCGKADGKPLKFNGFVPTAEYYTADGGINISTAVAISGAAASPNWGYHTNPATAVLMTFFNVRLGWWIFNPRRSALAGRLPKTSTHKPEWPSPRFGVFELAKELLGMTDDTSKYVYLSDGGHFDNMGLYELVRRRCYRIVICDAEQDEKYVFEGLGMTIRKCRIDFGVEITLDDMEHLRHNLKTGDCKAHFATGTIRYPETPDKPEQLGKILYIKSSLTGSIKWPKDPPTDPPTFDVLPSEPTDILNYKLQHESFPHDTTANQWFTESQFESYRRLGQHVAEEVGKCGRWADFR